jgi:isocitrate/isopropylmalate dehydrogenase
MKARKIVLIPGDGIGPEISETMQDLGGNLNTPELPGYWYSIYLI